ncbi:nitroreductase family protein [Paenibacillus sp. J5C_2022]|uniref:nitroreductase family protein n=1 Tax=Paenibacillus sp. J5C2022 TaxID=2977129 RepID=UPI0021D00675|nr:nitroreductase family protein [Paenibacillus sp. J5C2022]MCU6709525.1 nitroreductase family protein [Paenibacillus sp. J5C2022]
MYAAYTGAPKSHKLSESEILELLTIASTAPSAWNLQYWKYVVISTQAAKEKLLPIANNQRQVVEASAVIAVLGDFQANLNAEDIFAPAVASGHLPEKVKNGFVEQIEAQYVWESF